MKIRRLLIAFLLFVTAASCFSCERAESTGGAESTVNAADAQTTPTTETESVHETEVQTEPAAETESLIPDESFIGVWYTDEYRTDDILIYDITQDTVKFHSGVFKLFGFTATAVLKDGEFVFGDGISPDYTWPKGLKGRLRFAEGSVTIIYDDFGMFSESVGRDPNVFVCAIKDPDSAYHVEKFKDVKGLN